MRLAFVKLIGAIYALTAITTPVSAKRSAMCTLAGDGRLQLNFSIKPSMVVNSTVLNVKRGDLGLEGDAGESAFSFRRTIKSILQSANAPTDQTAQVAFLRTMVSSFQRSGGTLNPAAGIVMPVDGRDEALLLAPDKMLDETSDQAMRPLALFNRFDLAPEDWSHCGEHRIVYGKVNPGVPNRFLLIFEAMVPNPNVAAGEAGCRRVAEFWAGLSGLDASTDLENARRLSAFYYEGKTGHPEGNLTGPVVSYSNYGGDGGRGQVRANAFMQFPWQLREWLTQPTFAETGPIIAFVPVTVKDNPLAELYRDGLATHPQILSGNIPAAVTNLHGQFVQSLTSAIAPRLLSESSSKHRELVVELGQFDLGTEPAVSEATILLNTIALGNDERFNEFQSTSEPQSTEVPSDVPGKPEAESLTVRALLDKVGGLPSAQLSRQTGQTILNRATAGTCSGCHMNAAGAADFDQTGLVVRGNPDGTVVRWPDVDQGGFVHVHETTRALSPALEESFLPVRRYIMGRHLCDELRGPPASKPSVPYAEIARANPDVPVELVANYPRYVDKIVNDYLATTSPAGSPPAAGDQSMRSRIAPLSGSERAALRQKVRSAIAVARQIEQATPGAFVETRRPH